MPPLLPTAPSAPAVEQLRPCANNSVSVRDNVLHRLRLRTAPSPSAIASFTVNNVLFLLWLQLRLRLLPIGFHFSMGYNYPLRYHM
ncbi:signal recognition particle-docking protein FtsY [Sesbania bispinosa]|nr:signal recognition particle-docking protein FtsY [Sesbania bispinosa]